VRSELCNPSRSVFVHVRCVALCVALCVAREEEEQVAYICASSTHMYAYILFLQKLLRSVLRSVLRRY
jgi:hypothetical protein